MKNLKTILLLIVVAVALAAANYLLYLDGGERKETSRTTLVDQSCEVSGLTFCRKDAAEVSLERTASGWRLVSPYSGNADNQVVTKLIDALTLTSISAVMSESELLRLGRTKADFSLDDPMLRLVVRLRGGDSIVLGFGGPTPSADGVYASIEGTSAFYVVPSSVLAAIDIPADGFRCRSLFLTAVEQVDAFDIKRGTGAVLEFMHDAKGWKLKDEKASEQKVAKFVSDLASAKAVSFVWPIGSSNEAERVSNSLLAGFGLDSDSAITVSLKDHDGVYHKVSFGKDAGEGMVYALVQDGGAIVTVPAMFRDQAAQDTVLFTDSRIFPVEMRSVNFFSLAIDDILYALSQGKGGDWIIESPIAAPADQTVVSTILSRILALSTSDVVSAGGITVSIATNDTKVVVARDSVMGGLSGEDLRSKEMLRIDSAMVKRLVRVGGGEGAKPDSVIYSRDMKLWKVENGEDGGIVDTGGVESILSAINPLTAVKIERLKVSATDLVDYGLDTPFLTLAIDQQTEDSVRRNILLGKTTRGGRFATIGSFDAVFVISHESVKSLSSQILKK